MSCLSELSLSHFKEPFAVHEETKATSSNSNHYNQGVQRQIDFDASQWKQLLQHQSYEGEEAATGPNDQN